MNILSIPFFPNVSRYVDSDTVEIPRATFREVGLRPLPPIAQICGAPWTGLLRPETCSPRRGRGSKPLVQKGKSDINEIQITLVRCTGCKTSDEASRVARGYPL